MASNYVTMEVKNIPNNIDNSLKFKLGPYGSAEDIQNAVDDIRQANPTLKFQAEVEVIRTHDGDITDFIRIK